MTILERITSQNKHKLSRALQSEKTVSMQVIFRRGQQHRVLTGVRPQTVHDIKREPVWQECAGREAGKSLLCKTLKVKVSNFYFIVKGMGSH